MTDIEKVIEEVQAETMPFESWERLAGESVGFDHGAAGIRTTRGGLTV